VGFRLGPRRGTGTRIGADPGPWTVESDDEDEGHQISRPLAQEQPLWSGIDAGGLAVAGWRGDAVSPTIAEIDRHFVQIFALVGEAIAGATHALLAGDREAAKQLVQRDEVVDVLTHQIAVLAQHQLVNGDTTVDERRELVAVLRMLPDLERNGDLAEHIARRAARGLGAEMSARSRGLVERMGEVATTIWRSTADAFAERSLDGARYVDDLDDELDDLHVTLTAELVAGTMPLPVAIELAMVARFYERFGDHAVNLARRMAALVIGGPDPGAAGPD
jgi:phosphate transport system protein